ALLLGLLPRRGCARYGHGADRPAVRTHHDHGLAAALVGGRARRLVTGLGVRLGHILTIPTLVCPIRPPTSRASRPSRGRPARAPRGGRRPRGGARRSTTPAAVRGGRAAVAVPPSRRRPARGPR